MDSPFLQAQGLVRYLGLFLSGVCHQLPEHSFSVAGTQLPLCARCTGTYVGALLTLCILGAERRQRAARLPALTVVFALGVLFLLWLVDGVNSYFEFLSGRVWLYAPNNLLRLLTGMGLGLSVALLVVPVLNLTLWCYPSEERVVKDLRELALFLVVLSAVAALAQTHPAALFYPLFVADVVGVLLMLSLVNAAMAVIVLQRSNRAEHWPQTVLPLALGFLLSIVEVGGIALLRHALAGMLPWPIS